MHFPFVTATIAVLAVTLGGCTGSTAPAAKAAAKPPAPNLAKIVPANYTVTSQQSVDLVPGPGPDAIVVTSAGPGTQGSAVAGGTGDVQVLTYDQAAHRWNIALDAADVVPAPGSVEEPAPLLDQSSTLTHVTAKPVWFADRPAPDLLVYASDESANRPIGRAAVVEFRTGTADVVWSAGLLDTQNMTVPKIAGTGHEQTVELAADYVSPIDGACCPVRRFHQSVGGTDDGVRVVADDRAYLGAWLIPSLDAPAQAVVLGVDPSSPAARVLQPGDLFLGLADAPTPTQPDVGPPQVNLVAKHRAGDKVTLRIQRDGRTRVVSVTLGSHRDQAFVSTDGAQPPVGLLDLNVEVTTMRVTEVPEGPSFDAGIEADDTLVRVNGERVSSMDKLRAALWGTGGSPVPVVVSRRDGTARTLTVTPELQQPEDVDVPPTHV